MSDANLNVEADPYGDLEKPIEDARYMSRIVSSKMDEAGGIEAGDVMIARADWELLSFVVHHLDELIGDLHARYHRE